MIAVWYKISSVKSYILKSESYSILTFSSNKRSKRYMDRTLDQFIHLALIVSKMMTLNARRLGTNWNPIQFLMNRFVIRERDISHITVKFMGLCVPYDVHSQHHIEKVIKDRKAFSISNYLMEFHDQGIHTFYDQRFSNDNKLPWSSRLYSRLNFNVLHHYIINELWMVSSVMLLWAVLCSVVLCSRMLCSAVLCSTVFCVQQCFMFSSFMFSSVLCSAVLCSAVCVQQCWCSTVLCSAMFCSAVLVFSNAIFSSVVFSSFYRYSVEYHFLCCVQQPSVDFKFTIKIAI